MLETAFRDLPPSVQTGEILKVQVDTPNDATCDGSILYRDNTTQKLDQQKEKDSRCRWDIIVPETTRRGEADVIVTVKAGNGESVTLNATLNVTRRADILDLAIQDLPGTVKRSSGYTIRLDVPEGTLCQGLVTYVDGKTQALDVQSEHKGRCRWDPTVPGDVTRGTAKVSLTLTQDGRQTIVTTSFEVDKDNEDAELMIALQDLPTTVRQEGTLPIRALVPGGAKCSGEVTFRSSDNVKLAEVREEGGLCRWSIAVPDDAKRGDSEVKVTVSLGGKNQKITGAFNVDDSTSSVDAAFKSLPTSIRRGDDLEVRVSVPDGSTCSGAVTFDDGAVVNLDAKAEKKDRCLWELKVPTYTPRGTAVVRVIVDDHGVQTTLTGNVVVEGKEDESVTTSFASVPKEAKVGEKFDLSVKVNSGWTCSGSISFADGMRWTLGTTDAVKSRCTWTVEVPVHVSPGKAKIEVKLVRGDEKSTLTQEMEIKPKGS
jgi:hypothetical protein